LSFFVEKMQKRKKILEKRRNKAKKYQLILLILFFLAGNIFPVLPGFVRISQPILAAPLDSQRTEEKSGKAAVIEIPQADWQIKKSPQFRIKYAENGMVRNFWKKIWSVLKKKNIEARLSFRSDGTVQDLKEKEDFTVTYDFSGASLSLNPKAARKPGKYTLEAKFLSGNIDYDFSQDFLWGVLAINSNKSMYFPGEDAHFAIGVLDENGNMVCDAKVRLSITDPWGGVMNFSTENGGVKINREVCMSHNLTLESDYEATYRTGKAGTYKIELTAETKNGIHGAKDGFEVSDKKAFDLERVAATRIYPPNDYPVIFRITAQQDFSGEVREEVPASFEIKNPKPEAPNNFQIQDSAERSKKDLVWNIAVKKGEKIELEYQFRAPDESPQFYLLGFLAFIEKGKTVYKELRLWQIAADPTNMLLFWDGGSAPSGWEIVSDGAGEPFYNASYGGIFPRGAASYTANNGSMGVETHTHSATVTTSNGGAANEKSGPAGTGWSATGHTHTGSASVDSISSLPAYTNLKIIRYSGIPSGSTAIPSGAIAIFDSDGVPGTNWTDVSSSYSSYPYLRGASTAGGTGGSNTHAGTGHTVSSITLNATTNVVGTSSGTKQGHSESSHAHTVSGTTTSNTPATEPPNISILLGKASTDTTIPTGMIAMFDGDPGTGWNTVSGSGGDFENRFLKVTGTYGTKNGATSHTHTQMSTSSSSYTAPTAANGAGAIGTHSHTVYINLAEGSNTNIPPYTDVVIAKKEPTGISISGNIYQSGSESAQDTSTYTIYASVNNGDGSTNQVTTSTGSFTINNVAVSAGNSIAVYIYNNANDANAFTVTDGTTNISGLNLYVGRVSVGSDNGSNATTNANICNQSSYPTTSSPDDSLFSCSGNNVTVESGAECHILATKKYDTGSSATLTTQGSGGSLHIDDNASATISTTNSTISDAVSIDSGATLTTASSNSLNVGGNWTNAGTYTPNTGKIVFNAVSAGKAIDSGGTGIGKTFYDVEFNSATGGWTMQTNNIKIDHNLNFTSVSSFANSKSISIRVDGTLAVSADQAIRMWNSSAISYSVDSTGSLYSMDHNSIDGSLYIWGDYHTLANDYWSYATDFDGTDISITPRAAHVNINQGSLVTIDSGKNLAVVGQASASMTIVEKILTSSSGYGLIANGGNVNFQYADFENIDRTYSKGFEIKSGSTVSDLSYCRFNNLIGSANTDDALITVDPSVIGSNTPTYTGVKFYNSSNGAEFNVYIAGSGISGYWLFDQSSGDFDGEDYDGYNNGGTPTNDADPGMIRWVSIDKPGSRETIEGRVDFEGSVTFE
jgi:hypothetical protein